MYRLGTVGPQYLGPVTRYQHRIPRSSSDTRRIRKPYTLIGQSVDVGRFDNAIAIASEIGRQVLTNEPEDVGPVVDQVAASLIPAARSFAGFIYRLSRSGWT